MAQNQNANRCLSSSYPWLAAMLVGAVCQFCTCSFDLQEPSPRGRAIQQLFVASSTQQLSLYVLNLVVMAVLLPQNMLKVVPLLVGLFIFGRWASNGSGSGSGCSLSTRGLICFAVKTNSQYKKRQNTNKDITKSDRLQAHLKPQLLKTTQKNTKKNNKK